MICRLLLRSLYCLFSYGLLIALCKLLKRVFYCVNSNLLISPENKIDMVIFIIHGNQWNVLHPVYGSIKSRLAYVRYLICASWFVAVLPLRLVIQIISAVGTLKKHKGQS